MVISIAAAGLLAQVLPVGIFVLILESRRLTTYFEGATDLHSRFAQILYWVLFSGGTFGGLIATVLAASAVVRDQPLSGTAAVFVLVAGLVVSLAVLQFSSLIVLGESGLGDALFRMSERAKVRRAVRLASRQGRHEAEDR